ncbi:MAG: hypothetical protein COA96_16115 [SAR86 cluster bacterium]|uniref:Uncharacterized protein n=1 Tax=SAR86 cluster bacterium TaxID=2030880 RepID=A0A2A5ALF6_9GAMM|nr:MAG: hypothetical protein COA96_16115 [SAR86 cluster bacterium]
MLLNAMKILCPNNQETEIDDDVFRLAQSLEPNLDSHFNSTKHTLILRLDEIETPVRNQGVKLFRNEGTAKDIINGFRRQSDMEPIEVTNRNLNGTHNYKVKDGYHRY